MSWAGSQILDESDGSGNITSEYIFVGGKRVARRDVASGDVFFYVADLLGSARGIVQSGQTTPCYDADFSPFGGERVVTNTCAQNYKFEGKERDMETGNDDFGARYYSSTFGRFLSADWSSIPSPVPYANLTNPQTLNLYAIVSDNPESFADLDGHMCFKLNGGFVSVVNFLKDLKNAFSQVTVRVTIGVGWGRKINLGKMIFKGKLELGWKVNRSFSKGRLKASESTDAGADFKVGNKKKVGFSYSDEKVHGGYDFESGKVSGPEPATAEWTVGGKTTERGMSATADNVGYEEEEGATALGGGGITITQEGVKDLGQAADDALSAVDDAIAPPPTTTPPPPPEP